MPSTRLLSAPAFAILCFACVDPRGDIPPRGATVARDAGPGADGADPLAVWVEPDAPLAAVPPVFRLHLAGASVQQGPSWLLREGVSASELRELARGEPSAALRARMVPTVTFDDGLGARVVAPTVVLAARTALTLVAGLPPTTAGVVVAPDDDVPLLARVWPPAGDVEGAATFGVWCGEVDLPTLDQPLELQPGSHGGRIVTGVGGSGPEARTCLRWDASEPVSTSDARLPPPALALPDGGQVRFEPSLLVGEGVADDAVPAACDPPRLALGPACLDVDDDRALVRPPAAPTLWALELPDGSVRVRRSSGARFVVRPLAPGASQRLRAVLVDRAGATRVAAASVATLDPHAHLALSEVLADPLGPEASAEWVEIVNDGLTPASLAGYRIDRASAAWELGEGELAPGAYALVVGAGYVEDDGLDPRPAPGCTFVRQKGALGLSNAGEGLVLRDPAGAIASRLLPLRPRSGVSVVRAEFDAADDDPLAFALDAAGSATPCGPNARPAP